MNTQTYPPLTAYRVTYADGSSYITNCSADTTLADARAYFIGAIHEQPDEVTFRTVASVSQVDTRTGEPL